MKYYLFKINSRREVQQLPGRTTNQDFVLSTKVIGFDEKMNPIECWEEGYRQIAESYIGIGGDWTVIIVDMTRIE